MKQSKFGRAIAKALALAMTLSLFTVMPAVQAEDSQATITAYTSNGTQVSLTDSTDLSAAINAAGVGGKVEIGEGTVSLEKGIQIQTDGITITGAGIDKTFIRPADPKTYISKLENKEYDYKHLFEVFGNNINIENMTIDGTGVSGTTGFWLWEEPIDFVPLRLTRGTINLNSIKVVRTTTEDDKSSIKIGSTSDRCIVTATNSYVSANLNGSSYADIDITDGELTINGGLFGGTILTSSLSSSVKVPEYGYYPVTYGSFTIYTTIPYIIDCYNNINNNPNLLETLLGKLETTTIDGVNGIQKMAKDLANPKLKLYGCTTCNEQRDLAEEFNNVLTGIKGNNEITINTDFLNDPIATLESALLNTDWHTWGDDNTCDVCGATRAAATVTNTDTQCVPRTDSTTGEPDGSNLYGVRFVFEYNAGDTGAASANNYGAYVLDTSVFDNESSSDKTKLEYADDPLASGETFTVDVIDIPANTTVYAVPFADGVFGSIVSTTTDAAAASAGSLE